MDKPFLHKELSLSEAAIELKLDDIPHANAVKRILQYAQFDGLIIHIGSNITGYKADKPITGSSDPFGFPSMESIDGDVTPVSYLDGDIRLLSGSYDDNQDEPFCVSVSGFQQNDIDYYSVDQSEHLLYPSNHKENCFYIYREDLQEFINSMGNNDDSSALEESGGALKALAILAREHADRHSQFKSGNKVNASSFKEHIIKKATEYGVSLHGLKSIDNKISKILKELDLNDIPESDNS